MNCKDCFNAKSKLGKVGCMKGHWFFREYSIKSVIDNRIKAFSLLPKKCGDYSPPTKEAPKLEVKPIDTRILSRVIDTFIDGRKFVDLSDRTEVRCGKWEEWE